MCQPRDILTFFASRRVLIGIALLSTVVALHAQTSSFMHQETNRDAFARPAPALNAAELRLFNFGNRLFNTNWVVAPASAAGFDGLGPTFNRVSCSGCHLRDGRGRPPIDGETEFLSALLRISVPGIDSHGGPKALSNYGTQINDRAIPGVLPEARVMLSWTAVSGQYADGESFQLRRPVIKLTQAKFGALPKNLQTSLRVAPAVFGLGLLEAIPTAVVLAAADPADANRDGISGKANMVWSESLQKVALGRFGWKANVATLIDQNAGAAQGDIGITSRLHLAENCPAAQTACAKQPHGGKPELSDVFLEKLNAYVQMLGVPAPRAIAADDLASGKKLFVAFQCAACHTPQQSTATEASFAHLQSQRFEPYTDLLLHDMGEGLADGRADYLANGAEWRTAPLWGLGLVPSVNEHSFYLHDGRARNLAEAILWHGGEAQVSKQAFINANKPDREMLLRFLNAL